ncbi:MAG: acyltransferase family protein [Rhodobacteraceae bacterium]|nr:acyltransferase family protein [Paracoccaceae bacterium]
MRRLGDVAQGRDNNFNLIRLCAATAVLVSHAWPLTGGPGTPEPLQRLTGHSLGTLAVYVFFAVSGFFVSASFARRASAADFLIARGLRLFPALAVSLLLVVLVLGPVVTTLPLAEYLGAPGTARFLLRNLALVDPLYSLPGVFEANPYPKVEGSIWTLGYEVACYAMVCLAGLTGLTQRPRPLALAFGAYGVMWVAAATVHLPQRVEDLHLLSLPFVLGMAAWHARDRLPLSFAGVAALVLLAVLLRPTAAAFPALVAALAYATFWAGYLPLRAARLWNRAGDYSYGLYVYAFPVQGLVVWALGALTPAQNIALALPPTLALAVLSWHLIEKPALALRTARMRRARLVPAAR